MPLPKPLRHPLALIVLLAVVLGVGVGAWLLFRKPSAPDLPGPDSPAYQKYVAAFQVGVAALDVPDRPGKANANKPEDEGLGNLAQDSLTEAVTTIPGEPAGWANRGLWFLRRNQMNEAARDMREAEKLAPDRPEVQRLLGLLDRKNGKYDQAARRFRQALEKDPKDLPTLFALTQTLEQESGPDSDREILTLLNQALAIQPNNLRLLNAKGLVAVRLEDRQALGEVVAAYRRLEPGWSEKGAADARRLLSELEGQAQGPLTDVVSFTLNRLNNNLQPEHVYVHDSQAVGPDAQLEGEPIQQFLRLAPMRATASPPDTEMTFEAAPLPGPVAEAVAGARWDVILPVWLTQDAEPVVLAANGREVRRATGDAPPLEFPGGAKAVPPSARGVLPVDWNNDFRTDLLLAGAGGLRFYQQGENGRFTDVTAKTKLDQATLTADYFGAWAADVEMDGDLDLILAPRAGPVVVLRNNGDGTFKVIKPFPGVEGARAFVWADFDNDGAPDAAFLDAAGKLHVFANERSGQFRERELPAGLGKGVALAAADTKANIAGMLDLIILQDNGVLVFLYDKDKGRSFDVGGAGGTTSLGGDGKMKPLPIPIEPGAAALFAADLDNNGSLDLVASTEGGTYISLSREPGIFIGPGPAAPPRVATAVDLERTGRLDLLALSDAGQPLRLVNKGTKDYHWQVIRPRARDRRTEQISADNRINSFGIGGEVEIRAGLVVQKQPIAGPVVHFGLGEQPRTAVTRVVWPNGTFQVEFDQAADQTIGVLQRLTGSCPFLFTWDGRGMCFVADFMWGTPLGMYINAQATGGLTQQTEEWVKIRGDQLAPRDGRYNVRVTADLWETHFFDHLSLIVVDHPADTEVFADERFALTPQKPSLHVTGPPRPVARARDDLGQDVTETVRAIDGKYLDTFGRGLFQGVTRDHYVEVDLGDDAPAEGPVWLLASGWLHPTDSSLNLAIEQGSHDRPRPLVLEVPDGQGGWKTARDDIGFPAGKNKTILIRLDGLAGNAQVARRFRLRTNMEIYWDALRYAVGLETSRARQQRLDPETAELRHRGISLITQADASSPELPHYDTLVSRTQYWRDLIGYYTRYGDVRELLAKVDDRYVIMNAGDEMALTFRAPDGPPPGWKRDFMWVSDGWTKDGNLNTRFSKTVLPLPYHGLTSYDRPPGRLEDDPVYQRFPEDWKKYHTRYVRPAVFEQGLRSFRRPRP
jgi:cytochrome c-type biogenesis protein CcmH/NrfG